MGRIERFITSGIDDATRQRIGALPEGRGLLGPDHPRESLVPDRRTSAPIRAAPGFPPNHPPMTSFLGVPITVKGASLGRLYLTDKIGAAEFSRGGPGPRRDVRAARRRSRWRTRGSTSSSSDWP